MGGSVWKCGSKDQGTEREAVERVYGGTRYEPHASMENRRFVDAINIPDINIALITPERIAKRPPKSVNTTVVIHPKPFEYKAISLFENPISL